MAAENSTFRVIIAGGGVAGLTLANALQRDDIDCLLLEAWDDVAPPAGASIAINANGGRILDQIGALDEIYDVSTPSVRLEGYRDGNLFENNDFFRLNRARCGYSLNFLRRQSLLEILYRSVPNKDKILTGKRVSRVDCGQDGVVVQCKDGTSYEGTIVVGADGVHSVVRQEMWRHMNLESPGAVSDEEQHKMTAEYSCMYGISKPVKGLAQGCLYKTYGEDVSFLTTVGKQDQVFWFIFKKLDRQYTVPAIPKFTRQDAETQAQKLLSRRITDQVDFEDIWKQRETYQLAPLEEGLFSKWTWGRFACIGDSAHKWTPNIGQGGNNAIESAAALANSIHMLLSRTSKENLPACHEIAVSLEAFQSHRQARTEATFKIACKVTRLEALKGYAEKFVALYVLPNSGEFLATKLAESTIGSEKLEFLPDPERSLAGNMSFNQNYGVGKEASLPLRALLALPLLIIGYYCHINVQAIMDHPRVSSQLISVLTNSRLNFGSGQGVDLAPTYYGGVSWIERTFRPLIIVFAPSILNIGHAHRLQMISFLTDLAPLLLIWLLESHRRANATTFVRFPLAFGIASQLYGIGSFGPLYFFLHYIQSPLSKFAAFDQRFVNIAAACTALPALALTYSLPSLAMYLAPDLSMRLRINAMWQLFPLWLAITHYGLSKCFVKDTTNHDRLHNPFTDLPHIRFAMRGFAILSALIFNWVRWQSSSSLLTVFLSDAKSVLAISATTDSLDFVSGMALLLRKDHLSYLLASSVWLALLFRDLKEAEIVRTSWFKLASLAMPGAYVCGPGTVLAMAWLWREELLASKRAKGAVVRKTEDCAGMLLR